LSWNLIAREIHNGRPQQEFDAAMRCTAAREMSFDVDRINGVHARLWSAAQS